MDDEREFKTGCGPIHGVGPPASSADRAFDIWLQRGLTVLYGDIASEPVPEALLKLLDQGPRRD